jgi:hypothetical protein
MPCADANKINGRRPITKVGDAHRRQDLLYPSHVPLCWPRPHPRPPLLPTHLVSRPPPLCPPSHLAASRHVARGSSTPVVISFSCRRRGHPGRDSGEPPPAVLCPSPSTSSDGPRLSQTSFLSSYTRLDPIWNSMVFETLGLATVTGKECAILPGPKGEAIPSDLHLGQTSLPPFFTQNHEQRHGCGEGLSGATGSACFSLPAISKPSPAASHGHSRASPAPRSAAAAAASPCRAYQKLDWMPHPP